MTRPVSLSRWPAPHSPRRLARRMLLPFAGLIAATPALAEDEPSVTPEAEGGPLVLETVTVTARHSEEDVRDLPFSVLVVGGDEIEADGAVSIEDTFKSTPGIGYNSFGDTETANIKIRGVGTLSRVTGDDSSVVVYVDGMPHGVNAVSTQTLDIERMELLKGPQGTLYGRNSEAGAINIISRRPTDTAEGYVRGEIGTEDYRLTEGVISGPILDTLKGRLAFRYTGMDAWVDSADTGNPLDEAEDVVIRGTLVWEPTDTTTLTVIGNHEALTDHASYAVLRPYGDDPVSDVEEGRFDDNKWNTRVSAELEHEFPFAVATLFSGYTHTDYRNRPANYEGLLYEKLVGFRPDGFQTLYMHQNAYNQELRLSSRPENEIFWVTGANYYRSDRSWDTRDAYDYYNSTKTQNADIDRDFTVESYALFGEITYPIIDRLRVTGGLRHTWEHKTYDAVWQASDSNPSTLRYATDSQTLDDDYTTGRLGLSYDMTRELTVYGQYARGYKSGSWSDFGTYISEGESNPPFKAAVVNSYEIGFKSEWMGGDLAVNGALFWNVTKDDHLFLFDPATYTTTPYNFDTESKGAELDATWRMGHGFTLGGSLAYTDATITGVPAAAASLVGEGNQVPDVSKWSWTLSLTHEQALPDFMVFDNPMLTTTIRNQYVGDRPADAENHFDFSSYNILDFRLGLSTDEAEIYFRADNLLDERYDLNGYYYPAFVPGGNDATMGAPSQGRSFVFGASYYF